jgi:methyl-accepting chemotaxis protein
MGPFLMPIEFFLDLMGYALSEVVGKNHTMFVEEPYKSSQGYAEFCESLNRGLVRTAEFKRSGKGGKDVWFRATHTPILDLNGKPWKVVKYAVDIRQEKAAEQAEAMFLANMSHVVEWREMVESINNEFTSCLLSFFFFAFASFLH